jgi:hypothetical protein
MLHERDVKPAESNDWTPACAVFGENDHRLEMASDHFNGAFPLPAPVDPDGVHVESSPGSARPVTAPGRDRWPPGPAPPSCTDR